MKRKAMLLLSFMLMTTFFSTACSVRKYDSNNPAVSQIASNTELHKAFKKTQEIRPAEHPEKLPETAKSRKDTVIVGVTAVKGLFNPIYCNSNCDDYVAELIFDPLILNDEEGNAIPDLADSWDISADGRTYIFHLKKGIKFTTGEELTAEDVAFTYTALCDPGYDGPRADAVENLEGYKEYNKGNAKEVSGIKIIDPYTIAFTEKGVKAPALINDMIFGIMSKKYYYFEKGDIEKIKGLFLKPMGTGAFIFKEYKAGDTVTLEANPNFFKGVPKIKNIIMKLSDTQMKVQELNSGNVDMDMIVPKPENVDLLKASGFINLQLFSQNGYGYIGWNLRNELFKDKKVRQALTYGLNRKGFVDSYYKGYGEVCNIPESPASWAYTDEINKYEYSIDKANKLLDEAGWIKKEDGFRYKDGKKLTIHWLTYTGSKYVDNLIPIVEGDWKQIGVEVIPEFMEFSDLVERVYDKRDFEMYNMSWSISIDPDPSGIFGASQDALGGNNSVGWRNEESEKLMEEGIHNTDQIKRKEIYTTWLKLVNEELPYIFLNQSKDMWAVSSRIKGIEISPFRDWTYDMWKAEITN